MGCNDASIRSETFLPAWLQALRLPSRSQRVRHVGEEGASADAALSALLGALASGARPLPSACASSLISQTTIPVPIRRRYVPPLCAAIMCASIGPPFPIFRARLLTCQDKATTTRALAEVARGRRRDGRDSDFVISARAPRAGRLPIGDIALPIRLGHRSAPGVSGSRNGFDKSGLTL
jgi:hypothetical protein